MLRKWSYVLFFRLLEERGMGGGGAFKYASFCIYIDPHHIVYTSVSIILTPFTQHKSNLVGLNCPFLNSWAEGPWYGHPHFKVSSKLLQKYPSSEQSISKNIISIEHSGSCSDMYCTKSLTQKTCLLKTSLPSTLAELEPCPMSILGSLAARYGYSAERA